LAANKGHLEIVELLEQHLYNLDKKKYNQLAKL